MRFTPRVRPSLVKSMLNWVSQSLATRARSECVGLTLYVPVESERRFGAYDLPTCPKNCHHHGPENEIEWGAVESRDSP